MMKVAFGPEDVNGVVSEIRDGSTVRASRTQSDGFDWDDSGLQALFPTTHRHPVSRNEIPALELADRRVGNRLFKIRAANSNGHRSSANILIKRRYEWRGYEGASLPVDCNANRITLIATEHDEVIGTITVGLDGHEGFLAEDVFPAEMASVRTRGRKVCEFTKLAVGPTDSAKRVLASLFHVAFIVAQRVKRCDTLVLEVNPRHVNYYRRMLGCHVLGAERTNPHVNAPAVLLCVEFSYIDAQIAKFAGNASAAVNERTLYPYSFSQAEETCIIGRCMAGPWL